MYVEFHVMINDGHLTGDVYMDWERGHGYSCYMLRFAMITSHRTLRKHEPKGRGQILLSSYLPIPLFPPESDSSSTSWSYL